MKEGFDFYVPVALVAAAPGYSEEAGLVQRYIEFQVQLERY